MDYNEAMRGIYDTIIAIVWPLFWLYWFISAISAKKSGRYGRGYFGWTRIFIYLGAFIAVRLSNDHGNSWSYRSLMPHSLAVETFGFLLFVSGLLFAVWARLHIGRNWGMPMSQKAEPELVTSGPYALVRHPIYTGILTAIVGTALVISLYWLIIFVLAASYFIFSATKEEVYLVHAFPKTYPDYKRKTKMLLPYLL